MSEFSEILEKIDKFDFESQSLLVDIINRRYSETKRDIFIKETLQSSQDISEGNFNSGNSDDLFQELGL